MNDFITQITKTFSAITFTTLARLLIVLAIGLILIKYGIKLLRKLLSKTKLEPILQTFAARAIKGISFFVLTLTLADIIGLQTASLVTVLGALGLAASLALQDSLSNLAGGIFVIGTKPFGIGDFIEVCGVSGDVISVGFIHTKLNTIDNRCIYVPNGNISKEKIVNFSREANRRVEVIFPIGHHSNITAAKAVIEEQLRQNPLVLADEGLFVRVWELSPSSINIIARAWVKNADFLEARCSILEDVTHELDLSGIAIPYNRLEVTLNK